MEGIKGQQDKDGSSSNGTLNAQLNTAFFGIDSDQDNELVIADGEEFQYVKDYGVGIDCHSKFIVVTVLNHENDKIKIHQKNFETDWKYLTESKRWIQAVLEQKSTVPIDTSCNEFPHYVIESTGSFHFPVVRALGGEPSVINAALAGSSTRKTDNLDSRRLALHDLTGVWPKSYIKPVYVKELNVILNERKSFTRMATNYNNRIYSMLLKFGYTFGRKGSVTGNTEVRNEIMELINNGVGKRDDICPDGLPDSVKEILTNLYSKHDECQIQAAELKKEALKFVHSRDWPSGPESSIQGKKLMSLLMTAPGIGDITALTWIAFIGDPNRFESGKQVCAYCGFDPSLKVSAGKVTSTKKRHGNKQLHEALCRAANTVMKSNSEPLGRWGNRLYKESGRWKKAVNAVARKLCISLFYMHKRQESFSYDKYKLSKPTKVIDISFAKLVEIEPSFKRYVGILSAQGYSHTQELVDAYFDNKLDSVSGLGQRFYTLLKDFLGQQNKYQAIIDKNPES